MSTETGVAETPLKVEEKRQLQNRAKSGGALVPIIDGVKHGGVVLKLSMVHSALAFTTSQLTQRINHA